MGKILPFFLLNYYFSADFISGKILLETSSLIGREIKGKDGTETDIEYIQTTIKPHRCWRNTFFWEEYFWGNTS